ncbi:Phage-domain containing protein [Candidatus Cyrtobacter comes]|uniref:Phage-domain containing protein n=1 Tax=Candidatus Cyrtobacter comes TaxID=675776 RepID=A0ABU5L8A5_9RICK|nr:phage minor head protein [Candidatus Cyrtobacter comes]MDZ5762069.1 Phage-domain containing protein [Candidatus Cyrtobacter comes]
MKKIYNVHDQESCIKYGAPVPITKGYFQEEAIPQIYVWRTIGDEKVRTSHQENKIFTKNNPPATGGHPGADYNCRCIAEPYIQGVTEYAHQTVISDTTERLKQWG